MVTFNPPLVRPFRAIELPRSLASKPGCRFTFDLRQVRGGGSMTIVGADEGHVVLAGESAVFESYRDPLPPLPPLRWWQIAARVHRWRHPRTPPPLRWRLVPTLPPAR
jgi:hypothetical protein